MPSMTQINGTNYKISNAKTMNSSTNYSIKKGKTFVNGTNYNISVEPPFPKPSSHTPRDTITWDDKQWLVCHYDSSNNRVYLIANNIVGNSKFGSNTQYAGSILAARCTTYQNESMSAGAIAMCVPVTVNGVTAKVFVPSYEQFNGGLSYFIADRRRRLDTSYWTSSPSSISEGIVIYVNNGGGFVDYYGSPGALHGFRPCVCVQL